MRLDEGISDDNGKEPKFIRKNVSPLTGSEVYLLSKETIQKFICYTPKQTKSIEHSTIGSLLGVTEQQVPFHLKPREITSLPCWSICVHRFGQE